MTEINIDTKFLENNKVGTQCGTVGNTCFNDKSVLDILNNFFDKIELTEFDDEVTGIGDFIEDRIYVLPSAILTFKPNVKLYGETRVAFAEYYATYYDVPKSAINEDFDNDHDIIGEILMLRIGDAGGSWRYDGAGADNTAYFETE